MKRVYRGIKGVVDGEGKTHEVDGVKVTVQTEEDEAVVENGLFFKGWLEGMDFLEDVEIVFLIRIMKYVDHKDNTIRNKGEVMTVKEMAEKTGKEYTRLSRMVKELVEKKVMGKNSTETVEYAGRRRVVYSVNPYVFCRGRMINKEIREYYRTGARKVGR